ncbi:MAG: YkvA family protein [Pseudomonadota bacterium]
MMGRKNSKAKNDAVAVIELVRQGDEYVDARILSEQERFVADGFWPKVARYLAQIPFASDLTAAYYAATDPETPAVVRAWLLAALGYFIIPTDALPDFLFGIGFTDDAAVLAATMQMIFIHITPDHRKRAAAALEEVRAGQRQDPFQEPPE